MGDSIIWNHVYHAGCHQCLSMEILNSLPPRYEVTTRLAMQLSPTVKSRPSHQAVRLYCLPAVPFPSALMCLRV